jgi:hypothetical protein
MNVPLIRMEPAEAREQLREYRTSLHKRADAEYEAVAKGLEALADGTPILSLPQAIQAGGFDEKMRPRVAIARADRRQVAFRWAPRTTVGVFSTALPGAAGRATPTMIRSVDLGRRHGVKEGTSDAWIEGYALVPMIPAAVRNATRFLERETFILFEVEQWSDTRLGVQPDRDPYLLRHLRGDAYAVLAEWDLTPLEQLVMAGRRGN